MRHIERGPGEIAFEQALADSWRRKQLTEWKKDGQTLWHTFQAATTPEAKTALTLQWAQAWQPNTKKVAIEGFDYPPGEFAGLRHSGFSCETLVTPDGRPMSIHYRTYC